MNTQVLAYLSLKTHIVRCQQELGGQQTLEILSRIIEEIWQREQVDQK